MRFASCAKSPVQGGAEKNGAHYNIPLGGETVTPLPPASEAQRDVLKRPAA